MIIGKHKQKKGKKKDAARYQWLKKVAAETLCCIAYRHREACKFSIDEVDKCIDAAIKVDEKLEDEKTNKYRKSLCPSQNKEKHETP